MKIQFTDTTFRGGQQSLLATRLRTETMLPIIEKLDNAGFHALDIWGGATFESCLKYLKEDPWERLKKIGKAAKNTKLQMLLYGRNILGYKPYADDIIEAFIRKSIENGISILRISDPLNDLNNMEAAIKSTKKENGHAQLAITYTNSPVHTLEYFINLAKSMECIGADSICVQDTAGILLPQTTYNLIMELKNNINIPIHLHSNCTSGLASMTYLKAVEAGVDSIDTAISPLALGTSQPAVEVMDATFKNLGYQTNLKADILAEGELMLKPIREAALNTGLMNTKLLGININTLKYDIPSEMEYHIKSQLKAHNAKNKFNEVIEELEKVRFELGYPPLTIPISHIIATQSILNILNGERYKPAIEEIKYLVRGVYGKTTLPINENIIRTILGGQEQEFTPISTNTINNIKEFYQKEEDILTYILFPDISIEFFKHRQAVELQIDSDNINNIYPV
ncbi:MAG: pyruvate carboxylase subunit B [Lachnospirales bacterium]